MSTHLRPHVLQPGRPEHSNMGSPHSIRYQRGGTPAGDSLHSPKKTTGNQPLETSDWKPATGNQPLETSDWKPATGNQPLETARNHDGWLSGNLRRSLGGTFSGYVSVYECLYVCVSVWMLCSFHLLSDSFARLARRKAARSFMSNTQSLTISANMEGQSLWRASPLRLVSDALCTKSWRYWSTMAQRSDATTLAS